MAVLQGGQRLGAYVVEGLLGLGGMAEVYRGTHVTLERGVAIKVLNPAFNADTTFPLRFLREAKTVARLNHPNIITLYDFGEHGELAYLVMELATGGTFADRAVEFRTLRELVEGLAPVCEALHYAHAQDVVHRDLKPDNILYTEQERSKLADFGLARIRSETLDITEAGMVMGTPHFMAPEQAMGEDVDHRADIYAMGIITYRLVAGRPPYDGQTFFAILQQHLKAPPPSIREAVYDAPMTLDEAIRRATAKRREERFDSTVAFLAELRRAAAEAPELPVGRERPAPSSPPAAGGRREPRETAAAAAREVPVLLCTACGTQLREKDRFCRHCGTRRPEGQGVPPAAADLSAPTAVLSAGDVAEGRARERAGAPAAAAAARAGGSETAAGAGGVALPARRRVWRRRPTAFSAWQWLMLGTALLVVVFINAVGLWLAQAGRDAGAGNFAAGVTTYIFDNLRAFKSALTALALLLAGGAVFSMRTAIVDNHHLAPETYRRLRQYHRLAGYSAVLIAFAIGLLTCIGIFGFGTDSPRSAVHSALGTALLTLIAVKVAVVRYIPSQRRHLKLLGQTILVLFFLVFLTSTVPFLWDQISGDSGGYYYP